MSHSHPREPLVGMILRQQWGIADRPIRVKDNCNVQDKVVIHALENTSVLIGANTSLAHACIVHGPCKIGKGCFVGFGSWDNCKDMILEGKYYGNTT